MIIMRPKIMKYTEKPHIKGWDFTEITSRKVKYYQSEIVYTFWDVFVVVVYVLYTLQNCTTQSG